MAMFQKIFFNKLSFLKENKKDAQIIYELNI